MGVLREAMQREMALSGFAPRTQKTYLAWMRRLIRHVGGAPGEISESEVREYLASLAQRGLSPSSINQAINAMAFFFRHVLPRPGALQIKHQPIRQRAFRQAKVEARIAKPVSFPSLRHAFATHLLESGVNVRTIQALLGDRSLGSAQRYVHVAGDYLRQTRSPLDSLK